MQSPANAIEAASFAPTEAQVRATRLSLRKFLPLELADIIIDDAEYWPRIHSKCNEYIKVAAALQPDIKSVWCYLVSPPIPDTLAHEKAIHRIEFNVQSHDQGWATHPGPWSWFEATISQPSRTSNVPETFSNMVDRTFRPFDIRVYAAAGALYKERFGDSPPDSHRRWHVASNAIASNVKQTHVVSWTREYIDGHRDAKSLKGREGLGHELVRALRPGDRVALFALAEQLGWENHVYNASIDIYYSV